MSVIENLLALHSVDKQVRGLRSGVDNAAARLGAHQKQLDVHQSELADLQQSQRLAQATAANLETEGSAVDARVDKLREDLKTSATTKQYNAILEEINNLKENRGKLDERALTELERADTIGTDIEAAEGRIAERSTLAEAAQAELEERKSAVKERLDELEKERAVKAEVIPSAALQVFDQTADDFEGDAMAPIEELDRKRLEYACSTCNNSMPFSIVNTIMSDADRVHQCEGCLRILYMPEELKANLVVKK
jgi:predicted  nucleic acid-binding Zn-ribbon protein